MSGKLDPQRVKAHGKRPRRVGAGRRFKLHRLPAFVLVIVLAATVAGNQTARHLVQQHERDLLNQEANKVTVLFEQLGSSYAASIVGVAAIADVTDGDPAIFAEAVTKAEPGGTWSLLRATPNGLMTIASAGEVAIDLNQPPAEWRAGIETARGGEFAVLGLVGSGTDRRLGLSAGAGEMLVYDEIPLFTAAAQSATENVGDGDNEEMSGFLELDFALYIGAEPSEEGFIFETATPGPDAVQHVVNVGGSEVTLLIDSNTNLGGSLINRWPTMALALGVAVAVGLVTAIELSLRRRDDALRQVRHLATQNVALDTALHERQAAEDAKAAVEADLRQVQRLESVGQLAGGVAHDFNNLLAAILSYADLLSDRVDADCAEDLEEIRQAARRGADLTRRLLQFSRQDHDEVAVVDVGAVIADLTRLLERTIGEDVTLRTELCDGGCPVEADARSLEQVLLNLVINARDAVEPGGTIAVAATCVEIDPDEASRLPGIEAGPHVRMTVTDDGSGMTDDVVRRAFDPFFTTKGRAQGTGLGLATVYGSVQRYGGHVGISSEVGAGTQVTVLLPRATTEVTPEVAPPPASGHVHVGRVLVVEDEPAVRSAMRRMLERSGYDVLEASDGYQAVDEHTTTDIDLLVTDIVMPGSMTGADVAVRLREHRSDLPVLFVTGYGTDSLDQRGVHADGHRSVVLQKPFSEDQLLDAVGAILEGAHR